MSRSAGLHPPPWLAFCASMLTYAVLRRSCVDLIPSENDVLDLLQKTGALRHGHFRRPTGRHAEIYLQLPLVMRHYAESKALSVGLSRLLRAQDEVRRHLPNI